MPNSYFRFKQFNINHDHCAHKVGTDGVLLGAWARHPKPATILDIGSGSGLVALMMAQRFSEAEISAIEIHEPSYLQGKENFEESPFKERLIPLYGDFLDYSFDQKFDLIVSNPPFFKAVYSSGKEERDRARQERHLSHASLLRRAYALLNPKGIIALILPTEEAADIIAEARKCGLFLHERVKVFGNPSAPGKRRLLAFTSHNIPPKEHTIILRNDDDSWSHQYKMLTREFYLNF